MVGDAGTAGDEARSMGIGGRITGGTGVGELASLAEVMDSFLSASGVCYWTSTLPRITVE
jgi:hypothetical protein